MKKKENKSKKNGKEFKKKLIWKIDMNSNYNEEGENGRKYDLDRCEKQKMVQIRENNMRNMAVQKRKGQ